jgi:hypothetical protein
MATVHIEPMPVAYRHLSPEYRPGCPPIFPDGDPTRADVALAHELYEALDDESKAWYRRANPRVFGDL